MDNISIFAREVMKKYGLQEGDIDIGLTEAYLFHPEELEGLVQNPETLKEPRLVTTFSVNMAGEECFVHVISDQVTYEVVEIIKTFDEDSSTARPSGTTF